MMCPINEQVPALVMRSVENARVALEAKDAVAARLRARVAALESEVRSIHWSPYDRVGVVDADP